MNITSYDTDLQCVTYLPHVKRGLYCSVSYTIYLSFDCVDYTCVILLLLGIDGCFSFLLHAHSHSLYSICIKLHTHASLEGIIKLYFVWLIHLYIEYNKMQ